MSETALGDGPAMSSRRHGATKLRAPSVRDDRLVRPGLEARLRGQSTPLILVSASAGFGKTTAVLDWLQSENRHSVWINLDDRDDEPHRFFALVADALRPVVAARRLAGLLASGGDRSLGPSLWADALLEDLEGCDSPVTVVFDDLHHLTNPVITDVLDRVVSSVVEPVQWVLITRSDPPIRLGRLRAAGRITEIRAEHLAFSDEESADLLERITGSPWPPAMVRLLNDRIEGWPAGLQLAGLSLVGQHDNEGFLRAFGGDDRYIADYLIEEVLDREEPKVRDFLLTTSVVDEMTADLCDALTGRSDAADVLADLYRRNLFIVALGDGGEGREGRWYRYHHLFVELLRARMQAAGPARVADLLARAATWAEDHGELDESLRYHLRRPDRGLATSFARRHLPGLIRTGQIGRHRSWLVQFPNDWIEADPELLLSRAESELFGIEAQQALQDLDKVERLLRDGADGVTPGRIELRRAVAAFYVGDHDGCLDYAERALDHIEQHELGLSSVAHLYRGVVFSLRHDRDGASVELELAATEAERGGNYYAALSAHMSLGALAIHAGALDRAVHRFQAIEPMATSVAEPGAEFPLRGAGDVGLGLIALERLELEDAATRFRRGLHQLRATTAIDYTLLGYCRWADTESLAGDRDEALEILAEASDYVEHFAGTAPPYMTQALAAARGRVRLRQGDLEQARRIERRARAAPHQRRGELLHPAFELHALSARLHLAAGDLDAATADAAQLALDDAYDTCFQIERAVVQAELHLAADDRGATEVALDSGIRLAEPGRWVRPFVEAGDGVVALTVDRAPPWAADRLTEHVAGRRAAATGEPTSQPLVVPLTARELEVLGEIADGRTNAEIADRLYISVGTTKRHVANIFTKLDVSHRAEAAAQARRLGIVN